MQGKIPTWQGLYKDRLTEAGRLWRSWRKQKDKKKKEKQEKKTSKYWKQKHNLSSLYKILKLRNTKLDTINLYENKQK